MRELTRLLWYPQSQVRDFGLEVLPVYDEMVRVLIQPQQAWDPMKWCLRMALDLTLAKTIDCAGAWQCLENQYHH